MTCVNEFVNEFLVCPIEIHNQLYLQGNYR